LKPWEAVDLPAPAGRTLRVVATPGHGPADGDRGPVVGFVLFFTDDPETCVYFSGDTVWYEGVAEVAKRFPVTVAMLNLGAAHVPVAGPSHLTMNGAEAVEAAKAFANATLVPLHFEGWAHFSEGRAALEEVFATAGLAKGRVQWLEPGQPVTLGAAAAATATSRTR
jgi:L-ascorbate metabolism protein UlaG (beta-lactamase superfamily)